MQNLDITSETCTHACYCPLIYVLIIAIAYATAGWAVCLGVIDMPTLRFTCIYTYIAHVLLAIA